MTVLRDVRPLGGDAVDVRIEDGVIAEIGQGLDGDDVVEGHGAVLLPGWSTCTPTCVSRVARTPRR